MGLLIIWRLDMYESVACINKYKESFNAHNLKETKYKIIFGCGNCLNGRVSLNILKNVIDKNNCDICSCRFELIAR